MARDLEKNQDDLLSFNIAKEYSSYLCTLLKEFDYLWMSGNLKGALWNLYSIWGNVSPFLKDTANKKIDKLFKQLKETLYEKKKNLLSTQLQEMNRILRKKLNSVGLLIPTSEDPRFMFGR